MPSSVDRSAAFDPLRTRSRRPRPGLYVPVLLALLTLSPDLPFATDYFVATNGNDNNPGTSAAPFLTIARGISRLTAADDLYIKAGTYREAIDIGGLIGSASNPILISRFGTDVVILDGTGLTPSPPFESGVRLDSSSYVVIDGIRARNWNTSDFFAFGIFKSTHITLRNCEGTDSKSGIAIDRSSDFTVSNCRVSGNKFHGLWTEQSDRGVIDRVVAHDNSAGTENDGVHIGNSRDIVVSNSIAYNNREQGFDASGHDIPSSQRVTFRNCVAHHNGLSAAVGGFKVEGYQGDTITIENSIAYSNGWGGFTILGSKDVTLRHSTSWDNVDGLRVSNCGSPCVQNWQTNVIIRDNVFYDQSDPLTVASSTTSIALDYNGYYLAADDPDALEYKGRAYSLATLASYQLNEKQDVHSFAVNPLFVNTANPAGPDGVFFTPDDGLLLAPTSPLRAVASDGRSLGYTLDTGNDTTAPAAPLNLRVE